MSLRARLRPGVAIDMGSVRTRAWLAGRGVVLTVPTMTFPGPGSCYPVRRGSIVDAGECARLLERLLSRRLHRVGRRPLVVVTTPVLCDAGELSAALDALDVLAPRAVRAVTAVEAAALVGESDPAGPLFVIDLGAHVTEVALLSGGELTRARRSPMGTTDLAATGVPEALVRSVTVMVGELLDTDTTGQALAALERGPLLTGGGALWPELVHGLARQLGSTVRPAPAPHTAAVRGAALLASRP